MTKRMECDKIDTPLAPGQIDLWHLDLRADPETLAGAFALLSADERNRANRFHFERHRRRFVMARAALRSILARYTDTEPAALNFLYTAFGKPYLPPPDTLHFNLSHAHEAAVYAVASFEIGIDLEHLRPVPDAVELAQGNFSPTEIAALQSAHPADRSLTFLRCWTRKEAVVKACGSGLSTPLSTFTVPIDDWPKSFNWPDAPAGPSTWFVAPLPVSSGYIGAIAASQPITHIRQCGCAP